MCPPPPRPLFSSTQGSSQPHSAKRAKDPRSPRPSQPAPLHGYERLAARLDEFVASYPELLEDLGAAQGDLSRFRTALESRVSYDHAEHARLLADLRQVRKEEASLSRALQDVRTDLASRKRRAEQELEDLRSSLKRDFEKFESDIDLASTRRTIRDMERTIRRIKGVSEQEDPSTAAEVPGSSQQQQETPLERQEEQEEEELEKKQEEEQQEEELEKKQEEEQQQEEQQQEEQQQEEELEKKQDEEEEDVEKSRQRSEDDMVVLVEGEAGDADDRSVPAAADADAGLDLEPEGNGQQEKEDVPKKEPRRESTGGDRWPKALRWGGLVFPTQVAEPEANDPNDQNGMGDE